MQRLLRAAVDEQPALDAYRAWLAGEFRRGNIRGIVEAGRALSSYDPRLFASTLRVPVAAVVTTADRLVGPHKQRALAAALGAVMFELAADHDLPLTGGATFGRVTRAAVDDVAARAGLVTQIALP